MLLIALVAAEAAAFLALGALVLTRFGRGGLATGILLVILGLVAVGVGLGLRRASLGAHKAMVFLQTLVLIAAFAFVQASWRASLAAVVLAAGSLVAGFWPSTRVWFERSAAETAPDNGSHAGPRP
ncbi:hypothetical protein [Falsarthrobacter nasiphocae]|uniref:Uncharacterized protein n=1 Tax=Falsarthrobacter nasiphocae TaxID=189863 RepID=A0AAE3YG64_9MICC|nr:hypothetical protein [Falsarthrobacter nasiphocae]MDR6891416.1 hypothetical protein [Falsarthrobacter nasiphocae]